MDSKTNNYTIPNKATLLSTAYNNNDGLSLGLSIPSLQPAQRYNTYLNNNNETINTSSLTDQQLLYRAIKVENGPTITHSFDYSNLPYTNALNINSTKQNDLSLNPKSYNTNFQPQPNNMVYNNVDKLQLQATVIAEPINTTNNSNTNEPPCAPGGFLEPNFHFYVSTDALDTMKSLLTLLRDSNVDCEPNSGEYKIKCQTYRDHSRVEFVVRIFSPDPNCCVSSNKKYIVEFQRRFGDGASFHSIYRQAKQNLLECNNNPQQHQQQQQQPMSAPKGVLECLPCPSLSQVMLANLEKPCVIECVSKSIRCLVSMCQTECVDIKSQGLAALAHMSDRRDFHDYLVKYGGLDVFISNLNCSYEDVHRCCVTGLANLSQYSKSICEQIINNTTIKSELCNLTHSTCPEVVRQAARVVKNIATNIGDNSIMKDKDLKEIVDYLAMSNDEQARNSALHVLETCA